MLSSIAVRPVSACHVERTSSLLEHIMTHDCLRMAPPRVPKSLVLLYWSGCCSQEGHQKPQKGQVSSRTNRRKRCEPSLAVLAGRPAFKTEVFSRGASAACLCRMLCRVSSRGVCAVAFACRVRHLTGALFCLLCAQASDSELKALAAQAAGKTQQVKKERFVCRVKMPAIRGQGGRKREIEGDADACCIENPKRCMGFCIQRWVL